MLKKLITWTCLEFRMQDEEFKYLGKTLTNQNFIQEEIKR